MVEVNRDMKHHNQHVNSHPRTPLGALVGVSIGLPVFGARGVAGVGVGVGEVESVKRKEAIRIV